MSLGHTNTASATKSDSPPQIETEFPVLDRSISLDGNTTDLDVTLPSTNDSDSKNEQSLSLEYTRNSIENGTATPTNEESLSRNEQSMSLEYSASSGKTEDPEIVQESPAAVSCNIMEVK